MTADLDCKPSRIAFEQTGRPAAVNPAGSASAGTPAMFCGELRRVNASTIPTSRSSMRTVVSSIGGAGTGSTAPTSRSTVRNASSSAAVTRARLSCARR